MPPLDTHPTPSCNPAHSLTRLHSHYCTFAFNVHTHSHILKPDVMIFLVEDGVEDCVEICEGSDDATALSSIKYRHYNNTQLLSHQIR